MAEMKRCNDGRIVKEILDIIKDNEEKMGRRSKGNEKLRYIERKREEANGKWRKYDLFKFVLVLYN